MSDDPCCKDCRFWRVIYGPSRGHCRRRAPAARKFSLIENYLAEIGFAVCGEVPNTDWGAHEHASNDFTSWPVTDDDEWCGEFELRPEAAA